MLAKFHYMAMMNEPLWRGKYEMVTHSVEAMRTIREKNFEECCELLKGGQHCSFSSTMTFAQFQKRNWTS